MYTIYIDTHYINLVLALFKDNQIIDKKVLESNLHSKYTVSLLKDLLNDNNILVDDLKQIIVINGPGSFTGVRIGIVIAKILGFTKNIPIKTLSYLEAMALNYDGDVLVGLKDKNGSFIGQFDIDKELIGDYFYLSNKELDSFDKEIKYDSTIDLVKVFNYVKNKDSVLPHLLKPLYIKKLEVGK